MTRTATCLLAVLLTAALAGCGEKISDEQPLTQVQVAAAEQVLGLSLTPAERELMLADLDEQRAALAELRALDLPNAVAPALVLAPWPVGWEPAPDGPAPVYSDPGAVVLPADRRELAFYTVAELGALLRRGAITSLELTEFFLARLREHGPRLECVVSLTEDLAREQARRADAEIAAGQWRGPLHGIPYGVKDLLAVAGTVTSWGAEPYRDQELDETATVVTYLEEAGAVLVAKLTLGALAWGDVWYGGTTRNPWNLEEGSSGSSAGPAAAVAAGLVPFAIGSETWGSIVSPSTRCGVTGLRPTFGRVSRHGAMALSWSMDKLGPLARSVEDCAMVLDAIRGSDGLDLSVVDTPFPYTPDVDLGGLRIGYMAEAFAEDYDGRDLDAAALAALRDLGCELVPVPLPELDAAPLALILSVEAAAAFEELTLTGRDDRLVRQGRFAWPNVFRAAQFIPAVAYVQANRARTLLIEEMAQAFDAVDLYVGPSFGGQNLLVTNLTGHPSVTVPNGFRDEGSPHSITFTGGLCDEATLLAVARRWQEATGFHKQHPPLFGGGR